MRFVKGVICKVGKVIKELGGGCLIHTAHSRSRNKVCAFCLQHVCFFLGHGTAHNIRVSKAVARQLAENAHDLLLVHCTAVSFLQNRLQQRRVVLDLGGIVTALNIARDRVHGSRTVQRNDRDDVPEALGAQLHKHLLDAA